MAYTIKMKKRKKREEIPEYEDESEEKVYHGESLFSRESIN
jgi:hypothetical protein